MNYFQKAEELAHLNDRLNLSGRVFRLDDHAIKHGGCAYIWRGVFVASNARLGHESSSECCDLEHKEVAVKVIREFGTSASIVSLKKVRFQALHLSSYTDS